MAVHVQIDAPMSWIINISRVLLHEIAQACQIEIHMHPSLGKCISISFFQKNHHLLVYTESVYWIDPHFHLLYGLFKGWSEIWVQKCWVPFIFLFRLMLYIILFMYIPIWWWWWYDNLLKVSVNRFYSHNPHNLFISWSVK